MENGDNKWNILSRDVTPAQIITAIIVGAILLLLVILNILVYISYRKAVKSYAQIMEQNKNMATNFQTRMGHLFHRKKQDLDESNISGTSTASRGHTRSSEADTLPRKQTLDNELIENQVIPEVAEPKHKSILKHHPEHESAELNTESPRKHSSPHLFSFLHKSDDKHNTKHDAKKKHTKYSPALIKANTKKNGRRLSDTMRSLSVENLNVRESDRIHHSGPAKRVSLVASETQLEDIARVGHHQQHHHHQHHQGSSSIVTDFSKLTLDDSKTNHNTAHVKFKDDGPIKSNVTMTTVTSSAEVKEQHVSSHPQLHNRSEIHKGDNSHHSTKVIVSDLTHIDIKGENSVVKTNYIKPNVLNISKIPTPISTKRSHDEIMGDNSHTKGHNPALTSVNIKGSNSQTNSPVSVRISDFKHIEPDNDQHNLPESKGHNSHVSGSDSPVLISIKGLHQSDVKEDNSKYKGSVCGNTDTIAITQSVTEVHEAPTRGDNLMIEENVSTDTIDSYEAAMMAKQKDDYGEIEIVDTSSISRLRRPRADDTEFQNLAFDRTDRGTDLGTFYIGDVDL